VLVGLLFQQKKNHQTKSKQQQQKHGFDRTNTRRGRRAAKPPVEREQKARRVKRSASRTNNEKKSTSSTPATARNGMLRFDIRAGRGRRTLRAGSAAERGVLGGEMEAEARETRSGEKWEADLTFTASPFRSAASLQCCSCLTIRGGCAAYKACSERTPPASFARTQALVSVPRGRLVRAIAARP
jgi:hypothetical protein